MVAFMALVYHAWLSFHVLSFADYPYASPSTLKDQLRNYGVWTDQNGFGSVDGVLWRPTFTLFVGTIGTILGTGLNVADRFVALWMWIPLSVLPAFILTKRLTGSQLAAVVGACVFGFNTYFLAINTQGHVLLSLGAAWGVIATCVFVSATSVKTSARACVKLALALAVCGWYDLRFLYIQAFILILYAIALMLQRRRDGWRWIVQPALLLAISGAITVAVNAFWLAGDYTSGGGTQALDRTLFGDSYWQLRYAVSLHHPFWNGDGTNWFQTQSVPWWFWIVPILALLGAGIAWPSIHGKVFTITSAVGIFLAKQTAPPFGSVYPWLYAHFPGFDAFRESTKFYYPIAIGYAVLIACLVAWVEARVKAARREWWTPLAAPALALGVMMLFLVNTIPMLTGDIGSMFRQRHVPKGYPALAQSLEKDSTFYRTMWAPTFSRWSYQSTAHPAVSLVDALQGPWSSLTSDSSAIDGGTEFFKQANARQLLSSASVRYVVVPAEDTANEDDFYVYYGGSRDRFVQALDRISWLRHVDLDTPGLDVFENTAYTPHVTASVPVAFTSVSSTQYRVEISNLQPSSPATVFFGETYSNHWKLAPGSGAGPDCDAARSSGSTSQLAVDCTNVVPRGGPFRQLGSKPSGVAATEGDAWANQWQVTYAQVIDTFPKDSYRRNGDGSLTVGLVLYFGPETTFSRALVFSTAVLLTSLLFMLTPTVVGYARRIRPRSSTIPDPVDAAPPSNSIEPNDEAVRQEPAVTPTSPAARHPEDTSTAVTRLRARRDPG